MAVNNSKQFPAAGKYREPSSRNERPLSREEREIKHLARDFYREEKEIMKNLEKSFKKASLPMELEWVQNSILLYILVNSDSPNKSDSNSNFNITCRYKFSVYKLQVIYWGIWAALCKLLKKVAEDLSIFLKQNM